MSFSSSLRELKNGILYYAFSFQQEGTGKMQLFMIQNNSVTIGQLLIIIQILQDIYIFIIIQLLGSQYQDIMLTLSMKNNRYLLNYSNKTLDLNLLKCYKNYLLYK